MDTIWILFMTTPTSTISQETMALALGRYVILAIWLLTQVKGSGTAICAAKTFAGNVVRDLEKAAGTECPRSLHLPHVLACLILNCDRRTWARGSEDKTSGCDWARERSSVLPLIFMFYKLYQYLLMLAQPTCIFFISYTFIVVISIHLFIFFIFCV